MTLAELQAKRKELEAAIKNHPYAVDQKPEDKAAWDQLNADYDANLTILTAEKQRLDAEKAERDQIDARLNNVGSYQDIDPEAYNPRNRLGRDNGRIEDGPRNQFGRRDGTDEAQALALHGWLLAGSSESSRITDQHRQAAQRVGVNLAGNQFVLNLGGTDDFRRARAQYMAGIRNAMSVGDPGSGGYSVGQTLITTLERAMLDFSGVMQVAQVMRTTTGEPIEWITLDDTANTGSRVGENADAGTGSDPTLGRVRWSSYDFTSGLLYVSRSLLRDSVLNLVEQLGQMMGERLGRKQNTDYTTGGGGGLAPTGIVTASTVGVTAASGTAIVFDEVIDLEHSVDPSRRNLSGVGYMFHDSILKALRKLKDGEGRYLWQAGANSGAPDTLNARPYAINQAMASTIASAAKTMLFGQLSQYKVRQVGQVMIERLVERRAEFNQDVFIAHISGDGNLLDAGDHPVKHLLHP